MSFLELLFFFLALSPYSPLDGPIFDFVKLYGVVDWWLLLASVEALVDDRELGRGLLGVPQLRRFVPFLVKLELFVLVWSRAWSFLLTPEKHF